MTDTIHTLSAEAEAILSAPERLAGLKHAMLDLETLGRQPYCPVLAIGAVAFDPNSDAPVEDFFYQAITLDSCMKVGLRPDADTICWWMQQGDAARALFNDPEAVPLPNALDAFTSWLDSRPMKMWGNSARFDCGLLEAAYLACGKEVPWAWFEEGCYRTMKNLPGAKAVEIQRVGVHHHALDDALTQAMHLQAICKALQVQV